MTIKKMPKNFLSPLQAAEYFPEIFLPFATGIFYLSKSAAASCGVLNLDSEINKLCSDLRGKSEIQKIPNFLSLSLKR